MENPKPNREKEILNEIINKLKCEECDNYLYPPIIIEPNDNKIICGRCNKNSKDATIENYTYLSNICQLLEFPCFFKKYGCKEVCSWKEAEKHERACPFRQYKCPSLTTDCSWTGSPTDLRKHYNSSHTIFKDDDMKVIFDTDSANYLVEAVGELFVFQIKCDAEDDMLWYDVRYLGPPQRAPRFHFKVELYLKDDDRKYIERKQVEEDDNWELNEATAICIRIGMVQNMLKNSDDIYLKLKIDVRVPLYNGKVDEALMHEVECPVCKDHMIRPIRMCVSGHNFCNNCFHKLTECPTCRNKFTNVRNLSLETLSEHMHYRCMYFDEGCEFTDIPENIKEHEESCEVSFYECPLKQLFNCKWKGKVGHVCIHAAKEHQFKF